MVRLSTLDGVEFVLDQAVAFQSELIKDMINDCPDENQDMPIPLPNVRSEILTKVIEFCEYHRPDRQPLMKPKPAPAPDQTTTAKWLDQQHALASIAASVAKLGPLGTMPVNYHLLASVPAAVTDAPGNLQDTPGGSGTGAGAGLLSVPGGVRISVSLGTEDGASQIGQTQPTAEASGSGSGTRQGDVVKVEEEDVERSRADSVAPEMSTSVVLGPEDSASRSRDGHASGSGDQDHVEIMAVEAEENIEKDQGDGAGAAEGGHVDLDVNMSKDRKAGSFNGGFEGGEGAGADGVEVNPSETETVFETSLEARESVKGDGDGMKGDSNKGQEKEALKENNREKGGVDADLEPRPAGSTSKETFDNDTAGAPGAEPEQAQPDKEEEKVEMVPMNEAEESLADKEWDKKFIDVGQDMLFSLILTANFLYIPALLELGLSTVGNAIKGKPPAVVREMYGMSADFDPYRPLPRSSFKSTTKVKSRTKKKARTKGPDADDEEDDDMDVDDESEEETPPPVVLPPQRGTRSRPVRASRKAVDYTFAGDEVE